MREDHRELATESIKNIVTIAVATASKISEGTKNEEGMLFSSALGILCGSLMAFIKHSTCDVDERKEAYKNLYELFIESEVNF